MAPRSATSVVGRVAGLTAIVLLQGYCFFQPVPLPAKVLAAVLLAVSLASPAAGTLAFAGLAPLSTIIANLCGGAPGLGSQLLEQLALGIGTGVLIRPAPTETRTRLGVPALLMAVVAMASAASMIPAAAAPIARGLSDGPLLQQLVVRQTAQSSPVWAPMMAAILIAEYGLLGWAVERTVRREPPLAMRLIAMALIGHAGAAALNLQAVLAAALRSGNAWEALPGLLAGTRLSMQADVHAAASSLLLAGVAGVGLMSGPRARGVGAGMLLVLIAAGLWITGSRVALVLGVVATLAMIGWVVARTSNRRRWAVVVGALLALGVGLWLTMSLRTQSLRYGTASNSANARLALIQAGLQMVEEKPAFGIGISRFYGASARYLGGRLGENYHENAHNNFIQVLAEQGLVGLGAMLWWLTVVIGGGARAQLANSATGRGCLLVAIVACTGTWMTGHPLLVPEFAFVFWLYCGILAGITPSAPVGRSRWPAWVAIAGVLLTVAPRASALRNAADLEHQGLGLSPWHHDDIQRYREAGASFALFLPATGRPVELPLRHTRHTPDLVLVDISISGQLIDRVSVGEAWQTIVVVVPEGSRRFERVDFALHQPVPGANTAVGLLRVGKTMAR